LVEAEEVLTILPGTLPVESLAAQLAATDSAAVLKLGRTFGKVRDALERSGRLDEAWYVERATTGQQRIEPLKDVDPASAPYFSLALIPSPLNAERTYESAPVRSEPHPGEVVVVGLGPAGRPWLTPEVQEALAAADTLIGYGPYLDRVPHNPRQRRFPTDNRVEAERAAHALELAQEGARVVVVSSGDAGIFAMATAVLEVATEPRFADVDVRVLPGLTAAQAVASRVGAPLGHDFCVLSLSDILKPWDVVAARISAAAQADMVVAIYNPASKKRLWQVDAARKLFLEHRDPTTPVVVGRDVGGPTEQVTVTTLADLDPDTIDMRTLLIVGSSTTQAHVRNGRDIVFTPRRYPA
jgi:precorrin-2 C20-methyltransferase/precorrin-3B C17-methyltransferase